MKEDKLMDMKDEQTLISGVEALPLANWSVRRLYGIWRHNQ